MSSSSTDSSSQERNLTVAIQQRCNESVIFKLIEGADVNITDEHGKSALFYAIQSSYYKHVVEALIDAGADVNISDNDGKTALFYSIQSSNYKSAIAALIAAGADVNKTERYNAQTLLIHVVRQKKDESVVRALVDVANVGLNDTDNDGKTALFYAVQQGNKHLVKALIDAGADVNVSDNDGRTALFYALEQRNNESLVQLLIEAGADVNRVDNRGTTVLLHAFEQENFKSLVLSLIDAGADVNVLDSHHHSSLSYAVQRSNNESVVRALIKAGAEVNQPLAGNSSTALFFAVSHQSSNESVINALMDAGADVNITNDDGRTALFCADHQSVHTLIDAGADINLVDKHGETPFSLALTKRNTRDEGTVLALISRGANVNISKDGKTALLWAIKQRRKESVVRAMIEAGADGDVNKTDNNNKTALYYAVCSNTHEGIISALIDAGADVNSTYDGGETILFYAIKHNNNEAVVRKLVDAGAHVNISNHEGQTVLFYAVQYYHNDNAIKMLIDAGADIKIADNNDQNVLFHVVQSYTSNKEKGKKARVLIDLGAEVNKKDKSGKTALFYDAQSNNENLVRALIDAGANVHVTDSDDQIALFYAVQQSNNENMVHALIDAGSDVNKTDKYGYTALFHAIEHRKNENTVKALIAAHADVNVILNDGQTALFYAVQREDNENIVQALIEAGADVSINDKYGRTALFYAVQISWYDNEGVVRSLIEANKDILTVKDTYGRTALFYVNLKSRKTFSYLLQNGGIGCLRLKDNCNVDILTFAIENCISQTGTCDTIKGGILDELTKQGTIKRERFARAIINIMFRKYVSEVLYSSNLERFFYSFRNFEELARLYEGSVDYNVWERTTKMASLMAVLKKEFRSTSRALELLVELGADPDSADSGGNTALHLTARSPLSGASEETVMDLCKNLKKFEVRFSARNHQNQTPLLFCISEISETKLQSTAIKSVVKVCRFLLKNGSSTEETSRDGEAVFHYMIKLFKGSLKLHDKRERQEVLRDFIELLQIFRLPSESAKVAVNKSDVNLNSPLHLWASLALTSPQDYTIQLTDDHTFQSILKLILKSLLECGAKVNARNCNDETPLHLCKTWFAVKMLIDAGANVNDVDSSRRSALLVAAKNQLFLQNPDCFYPDISEESKSFWKNALRMGLDPFTADKQNESVLGILIASENFILAKSLVDVACEENRTLCEKVTNSLLCAICKDKSTRTHWKTGLVQDILKSKKSVTSAATALCFCCENVVEGSVLDIQQGKAVPIEVDVGENDEDVPSCPKRRRVDRNEIDEKGWALDPETSISVHLEIINILRWFGAANEEACKEAAKKYTPLKRFLMNKVDMNEIPMFIPWTSVSKRYEDKLAKVSRRQECEEIDQYWYHKDHVGSGSFGHIFVGINGKDGREVAIKRIETLRMQRSEDKREIESLGALAYCEQVVSYLHFLENKNDFSYIILELMEGNLEEYLTNVFTFNVRKSTELCQDVVKGLRYLHESDILHRDLKPQNILYKTHPKLCLKIADFGLSRRADSNSTTVYGTNAGTRCWIAPEVLKGTDHSKASDMFSCGLLLHYILSERKHPFSPADFVNKSESQLANETEANIMDNTIMEGLDNRLSPEATHLIKWMLESDEKKRATAGEALDHPFCYSKKKKMDFLEAVGNQKEFECPRAKRCPPLTAVENDIETKFSIIVRHGKWNDSKYFHMPAIYTEMTKKRSYATSSAVDLVRLIRNAYAHVSDTRPTPIKKMLLEDFVFLETFPNLVMEVYTAVTTHGWDQSRDEIKYVLKN